MQGGKRPATLSSAYLPYADRMSHSLEAGIVFPHLRPEEYSPEKLLESLILTAPGTEPSCEVVVCHRERV